jgi:hypothetical protein
VNLFLFFLSFLSGTKMSTHIEKMIRLNSFRHQGRRARMKEQVERAAIFLLRLHGFFLSASLATLAIFQPRPIIR